MSSVVFCLVSLISVAKLAHFLHCPCREERLCTLIGAAKKRLKEESFQASIKAWTAREGVLIFVQVGESKGK
ncbi:hypothetical protein HMPREF1869_01329 [Bacteroidales bacterium KA00251]|nr:hypothetical protein HMPREF1869_01329 [Bacteroidales bacterium KA00251]